MLFGTFWLAEGSNNNSWAFGSVIAYKKSRVEAEPEVVATQKRLRDKILVSEAKII